MTTAPPYWLIHRGWSHLKRNTGFAHRESTDFHSNPLPLDFGHRLRLFSGNSVHFFNGISFLEHFSQRTFTRTLTQTRNLGWDFGTSSLCFRQTKNFPALLYFDFTSSLTINYIHFAHNLILVHKMETLKADTFSFTGRVAESNSWKNKNIFLRATFTVWQRESLRK